MTRDEKLAKLKAKQLTPVMVTGVEPFIEALEKKITQLKETLGEGVELKGTDDLLDQLSTLQSFHEEVKTLKETISKISLPDSISVNGLEELVKAAQILSKKESKFEFDTKPFTEVAKKLDGLITKIDTLKAPKQGQQPDDYIPMRRVMLVGKTLMYDDSFYTGGGGGSSVPTKNGAVPVVNPDGSNIGGGSGGDASAANQVTGNTSLASIDTKTPALGQALAASSVPVVLTSAQISTLTPTGLTDTQLRASAVPVSLSTVTTLTNQTQEGGVNISLNAGAVDTGTRRVVQANGAGKTILSAGGSASSSGNNTLIAAGTNKLKIFAFSLTTTSATAVTCIFQSGASGTELWRVVLQAPASVSVGANLAVSPPAWLFSTASATLLNLNLSGAQTVNWSCSYFDEA